MARRKKQIVPLDLSNPMLVRDDIVLDLLQKFPVGPNKTLTRDDYYTTWDGHPKLEEPSALGCHQDACGYPDLVLYRLNLKGWSIRDYVRQRWPGLRQAGVTRRSNRLVKRIEGAYNRTRRAGLPGLWKVSYGWEDYKGAVVFAENKAHALQQAGLFFGPAFAGAEVNEVSFVAEGSPLDITKHNKRSRGDLKKRMANVEASIKRLEAQREQMEFLETTHEIYSVQAVVQPE
jgi:hypothetical protein